MRDGVFRELADGATLYYTWFEAMHTRIDLILCGLSESGGRSVSDRLEDAVSLIGKKVNRFDPQSGLSRLNARAGAPLDRELYAMIRDAARWHARTEGCFDITVQSLPGSLGVPGLRFDDGHAALGFADGTTVLDLNGYAKGYALDRCVDLLRDAGVGNALVNIGNSSVAAVGSHPYGHGWKVGVESPWSPGSMLLEVVLKPGEVLTTSGNEGAERAHIIDPLGGGLRKGRGMVSVLTRSGVAGEVLSTALFAASPDQRKKTALLEECLAWWEMVP